MQNITHLEEMLESPIPFALSRVTQQNLIIAGSCGELRLPAVAW